MRGFLMNWSGAAWTTCHPICVRTYLFSMRAGLRGIGLIKSKKPGKKPRKSFRPSKRARIQPLRPKSASASWSPFLNYTVPRGRTQGFKGENGNKENLNGENDESVPGHGHHSTLAGIPSRHRQGKIR